VTRLGGAKKKSISKIEDAQLAQEKKQQQRKTKGKVALEKRERGIRMPDIGDPKLLSDLSKIGALTPYSLASQYNLKMSVAKDLLEELARKSLVRQVGGNARIRIYQPAAAA
jgi:small subunit ribosomal protein S25e